MKKNNNKKDSSSIPYMFWFVHAKYIVLEKEETISIRLSPGIDRQRMRQPRHRNGLRYSRDHILLSDPVLR